MNQYNLIFILYSIELVSIILFLKIYLSKKQEESLIFDPLLFFILGSTFIYIFVPWLMYIFDWSWHHVKYSLTSYFYANLFVYGYIFMVVFFYTIFHTLSNRRIAIKNNNKDKSFFYSLTKKQNIVLLLFILLPVLIDTLYLLKYIFSFDTSYYLKNRIILRKGMGFAILLSYMGTLIVPIMFAKTLIYIKNKSKLKSIFSLFIFSIFILLPFLTAYIMMGNRLTALILLIMIILIYLIVMKKNFTFIFYLKLILVFGILFLFFAFLGYMRSIQGDWSRVDFALLFTLIGYETEHAIVGNFGNFEHLVWLIDNQDTWNPFYGETYIAAIFNLVPRFLWEDKLLGGGPNLKNIIHPGSYDLLSENITSYTTGMAIEGYMNFRIAAIFIVTFFHAIFLIILKKISYNIKGNIILLSLYVYLLFSVTFLMIFGEFLGIYTRTLIVSMPFVIFYIFSKKQHKIKG